MGIEIGLKIENREFRVTEVTKYFSLEGENSYN